MKPREHRPARGADEGHAVSESYGVWGPKSAKALSGFEAKHGLKPDGVIDETVLELLELEQAA